MMKRKVLIRFLYVALAAMLLNACRGEMPVIQSEEEEVGKNPLGGEDIKGMFLLNEGNMGSNKCTLDFYDCTTGKYHRNIYAERNPSVVKELGDVGNDLQIYGDKLYAVINCSHFVEVMDVHTAQHLGKIDVTNCRYMAFHKDKAYVSSYAGPVQIDPTARPGKVVEIDTVSLAVTREVVVGYQPEEMVVVGDKLYVANSGGYRAPNYDRTVSVVDLNTFTVVKTIDVAINLHRMAVDNHGNIYVSSRGDYKGQSSDVFVLNSETDRVTGSLGIAANEMCLNGDSLYMTSVELNTVTGSNAIGYAIYDIAKKEIVSRNFITDGTDKLIKIPYGVAINPETKDIYVTDAKNYVTPGTLYCFSPEGKKRWSIRTGDIPASFAFSTKKFY